MALQFDELTCAWQSLGESGQVKNTELENEIVAVLDELSKATIATIAKTISKDFSNSRRKLISMWMDRKVSREEIEGKMFYYLPVKDSGK